MTARGSGRRGKALVNRHRLEILHPLAQGERSAEVLASRAGITVGLASAHLQMLRRRAGRVIVPRPPQEHGAAHLPGVLSIPLSPLEARPAEPPADVDIVAYRRGPYCAPASEGVARRLDHRLPEWRLARLQLVMRQLPA